MEGLRRFLAFAGRSTRLEYWKVQLASSIGAGACVLVAMLLVPLVGQAGGVVMLGVVPLVVASVATGVRRLHDRNRSGWWLLAYWLAPTLVSAWAETVPEDSSVFLVAAALSLAGLVITVWSLVELGFLRGVTGPNRYGADPSQPTTAEVFS